MHPATSSAPRLEPTENASPSTVAVLGGIGILGGSTVDEYRGTDNRGGQYSSVTFNMVEQLVILRGFNLGAWGDYDEPRRTGFEYNWARSSATSTTMIQQGQHTGVAEQVARGEVTYVFIHIGGNDFGPHIGDTYQKIYDGSMSDERVQEKVDNAIASVTLAVDTVLDAGALGVGITLFPHWYYEPTIAQQFPDPAGRQRVEDAISTVNEGLKAMAAERGIIVVDPNALALELIAGLDENNMLNVGGELIDFVNPGNEPHHARLQDTTGHAGTVLSGLMANYYFVEPLNTYFDANIPPLTDEEILSLAGIGGD